MKYRLISRKPRTDIKEVTEVENVTFRPRRTKTKEDVEQEFKISLNTYEEEDISMSGKVRLKPKKRPMTYSEETGEETIRFIQEVEDDSGPVIEEIIDESDEEGKYSIEELETDEMKIPLRRKVKKQPRPYSVEEFEEGDVQMKLKRERKYSYEETDESLALKLKAKRRPSTYDEEEATLSITREEDIYEEEVEYVVRDGDTMYSICSYVAETDEAINLVEGEKVYIIDHTNQDWWFVKKNLTEEKGWVPAQYLLDEVHYTIYLQRKLHEKIDKLPVFEKPAPGEKASAPRFIEKLQPIHTPDGYTVQFECQVEGVPRPQITWFRQTAIIKPSPDFQIYYDDDNVATLIIREVFPEDAGTFTCVAKNTAGFASSTTELIVEAPLSDHGSDLTGPSRKSLSRESSLADILEGIPPTFSRKPKAKYVNEGDDVILESRLVAVPEPEISWYYKDTQLTSKENIVITSESDMHMYCSIVKISKVQKIQEGRYKIVAKNREGEASIEIPLKVKTRDNEPPEILEPLQSYVVREGETVVLSTQIVGNPAPKIVWYKDGKPIKDLTPQQDGHVNTLTIIQPKLENTGEYSVVATNNLGKAETQATLIVEMNLHLKSALLINIEQQDEEFCILSSKEIPSGAPEPPLFTERFQEVIVPEKGTFKLVAKVTGNPVPEITWLRNNEPLEKSPNIKISYDGENISLEIKNADSETDSGDYKCVASNPVGKASHGAKVTVDVDKVTFTKKLKEKVTVDEYKMLELVCETSHTVSTTWWHNEKEISGMDHREIVQEGRVHKLVIKKTNAIDEGTYKCTVKNQTTSSTVTVKPAKPEFTRKLQDFEVKERETAILEVEITSETVDVEWYKDGVPLKPSNEKLDFVKEGTVRKLLIRSTSVHDEGEYTCTLLNQQCTAEVTVVELPPEIITKMQDVTIARGEKAIFDIELTKGDALVRWFKDNQELQFSEHVQLSIDGKRQKLKIYDTESEDAGVYSCQVGEQTSSAKLIVEEPGVDFIARLPDVTLVPLNKDATFLIEISQSNIPVTWLRKGEIIKKSEKYVIIDEGNIKKLIVKKCTTEDIAEYTAVVTNVKTSSRLKVEIIETPPKINPNTQTKYTVNKEDDIEIIVKFTATPMPTDEWTVDGRIVTKSKRITPSIDEESAVLTITKVQEEDVGDYNLRLFNPHGDASIVISVAIAQPPSKPGTPEPLELTDESITLHWKKPESDGNLPITEYILEYHEKVETSWIKVTEKITETSHKVTKLTTNKEYTFRVTAVNKIGLSEPSSESPYFKIVKPSELEPPIILEPLRSVNVGLKQSVTLSCVIGGSPAPEITWFKNNQPFANANITYENRVAKYIISETTETSSATFTVKAENEVGTAETTCELKIQESPKLTVDETLANQKLPVSSEWKIDVQTSGFPTPDVTWSKNSQKIIDKRVSTHTVEKISIISINSIIREDTGTYTAEAINEAGTSSIDVHLKVIDKPSKPQGPIITKEIRQDRITVEWKAPIDDGGVEIEKYTIEKCETAKMNWTKVADVDKDIESFCVQKLQLEVEYMFRVIAKNSVGASEPLESERIKTRKSDDPPGPPRGPLEVSGMTKTSFTIKWQAPENDGGSPIIDYTIEMTESSKKAWQKVGNTKAEVTNISVSNLKTDMAYDFRITARNKIGMSEPYISEEPIIAGKRAKITKLTDSNLYALLGIFPPSKIVLTKTPPSSPLNVRVINFTSKSVTLTWSPPANNGGTELTGYIIEKRPLIGKGSRWIKVVTLEATTHQYCIENLKESEFLFRVFAENSMGLSLPTNSEPVTLKTHATVPSAPTAPLEIRQIAANTVVIEWGKPESDGGAPLEGYRIVMRDAKKTMWIEVGRVKADILKINIKDLQENHEYLVRIYVRNEVGLSEPLESDEPFKILPTSELAVVEPVAEATDKGEPASVSFSTENTSSWLREHNMDADIHSYARGRLLRKDEYFFRIWHNAKKLFK
ncbi:PREDICTED: titin [Polistes canadensis]|uniref:titin n=1 Tax=Polistes canadensis TaxID=91411 RepID=UPI0007190538|nr:PREDICTED: titin [Polistes canadensis]